MIPVDVVGSVTVLTGADPAVCDQAALAELVSTAQRVRGWLDSVDARIGPEFEPAGLTCGVPDGPGPLDVPRTADCFDDVQTP